MKNYIYEKDILKMFLYFCEERYNIFTRKEILGENGPWTADGILKLGSFCNVNREDDRVTIWVKKNVRDKLKKADKTKLICNILIARVFNHPPFLELIYPEVLDMDFTRKNISALIKKIADLRATGVKCMRGAYMMAPHGNDREGKTPEGYFLRIVEKVWSLKSKLDKTKTFQEVYDILKELHGLGGFTINQICADLRYTPQYKKASDWESFIIAGPGTRRGLNRLAGRPIDMAGKEDKFIVELLHIRKTFFNLTEYLLYGFNDINNLSNCFCEFDKYLRAQDLIDSGKKLKMRRKYNYGNSK